MMDCLRCLILFVSDKFTEHFMIAMLSHDSLPSLKILSMSHCSACPMIDTLVSRSKKMVEVVDKAIIPCSHLLQEYKCFSVRLLSFVISLKLPRISSKIDLLSLSPFFNIFACIRRWCHSKMSEFSNYKKSPRKSTIANACFMTPSDYYILHQPSSTLRIRSSWMHVPDVRTQSA